MQSVPRGHAPRPDTHAQTQISSQIRKFGMAWLAVAMIVVIAIAASRFISQILSDSTAARADTTRAAQQSEARLEAALQQEIQDRLAWEITRQPAYVARIRVDGTATRNAAAQLNDLAHAAGTGTPWPQVAALTGEVKKWDTQVTSQLPAAPPRAALDPVAEKLQRRLGGLSEAIDSQATASADASAHAAWRTDMVRLATTVLGLLILLMGGGVVLRKAWRLAADADARRERERRWSQQMESILEWSNRAKEATTRGQLIGFAHQAPHEALGAHCLRVAEAYPPRHESHGLARITLPVDDAGQGLHISVCFAEGRGDELDHHTLDLMLGHLGALWRTVMRQEELERAAGHDALTGLPNRRTFDADLRRRIGLSKRRGLGFALAIVDLDHFKLVNDSLGHPEGDAVLRRAGEAIRGVLRASDRIYRLGGEEFALMLETSDSGGVEEVLNRAREAVKALGVEPAPGRRTSASIGWATFPDDATERGDLVAAADTALYRAKNSGRDRVVAAGEPAQAA